MDLITMAVGINNTWNKPFPTVLLFLDMTKLEHKYTWAHQTFFFSMAFFFLNTFPDFTISLVMYTFTLKYGLACEMDCWFISNFINTFLIKVIFLVLACVKYSRWK